MTHILYFHGLGSGPSSRKFKLIDAHFRQHYTVKCISWNIHTDISVLIFNLFRQYKDHEDIVLIGDSTGGNYAYQFRDLLRKNGVAVKLILLNPLLHIDHRIASFPFPETLVDSLWQINQIDNCFLLLGDQDEVIEHGNINLCRGVVLEIVKDSHRLPHFAEYLHFLSDYLEEWT